MRTIISTFIFVGFWLVCTANDPINPTTINDTGNSSAIADSCRKYYFLYECDTIIQCATIDILNDSKITFRIKCHNKLKNITTEINGVAVNKFKNFGASETDEDEQGNLYPVLEYIYNGKCWLAFRFNTKFTKLNIKEADNDAYNAYCPFGSIVPLNRLNKSCDEK